MQDRPFTQWQQHYVAVRREQASAPGVLKMAGRRGQSGTIRLDGNSARDDRELRRVCDDTAMGRWEAARDLLRATGQDWDRRVFRLQVLAYGAVGLRWAETWADTERHNPDALVMLAHVQAVRSMLGGAAGAGDTVDQAWDTCRRAADAYGADPSPWVVMMALLRVHRPDGKMLMRIWKEVQSRDPYNLEAHHELVTYAFERNHGTDAQMHNWARELAYAAPKGSAISVVLLVAHAETAGAQLAQDSRTHSVTVQPWMDHPEIDFVLDSWWRCRPQRPHGRFMDDANYLAHALCHAARHEEAFEVFDAIGPYASRLPWAYGGDASDLFLRHRGWALRAARSHR